MKKNKFVQAVIFLLPLLAVSMLTFGQTRLVTGNVQDPDGNPLVGVNVVLQGTTAGTTTDLNGNYSIEASNESILTFSFIGYSVQNIAVGNQTKINVKLQPDITELSDVVVVGYGTQQRQNLTGSVSKLSSENLETKPVSTIESALQGQVSGVTVVNTGGPGTSPTVRIRGIGSVSYSSNPLYVIDGIPVSNLNNFDVKDIESVSILKDAASAAIYGSRAANGVVIITTKSGKASDMTLNIDASIGTQKAWSKLDLLSRDEYIQYGTELLTNAELELPYRFSNMNEPIYEGTSQTYAQTETDWQDEMFRAAPMSQLNISMAGGNEKTKIYTSYGRYDQTGIMQGTDYTRNSFRINAESKLNDFISIGENLKASYSETRNERTDGGRTLAKHIVNQVPYVPVYNPNNIGGFGGAQTTDGSDPANPLRIALLDSDKTKVVNLLGNVYAELKLTSWLKFRSSLGVEYSSNRRNTDLPIFSEGYNQRTEHELSEERSIYYSPVFTNQLTFNQTFDKHSINAVAVVEQQQTFYSVLNANGKQSTNDLSQLAGSYAQSVDGRKEETVLLSYAGRINYSYAFKYLFNVSVRRDGSSVFAPGKKWGTFPGASVGWVISKESFMENIEPLSNLKLRASYGSLGFNAVGAYPWQSPFYTNTTAVFNDNYENNVGAYFNKLSNKELEWEITTMSNFGLDLGLFDNTITFSAEYFNRQTDNLIVDNPLPTSMGYAINPATNIGSMKNWGYEFNAGYNNQIGDVTFSIDGNLTFINNEVLALSTGQPTIDRSGVTSDYGGYAITRTEAGYPIQGFYGWVVDGIFKTQGEIDALNPDPANGVYYQTNSTSRGDIKFKDINGRDADGNLTGQPDGVVDEDDRTYIGSYLPDFTYGLNFTASYKGFAASLFIQGVHGNEIYNGTKVLTQGMMRLFNADKDVLDAWTPQNTDTDIPRAISGDPNHNARTSDRFIEDGSYLRIKNLTLSYDLPSKLMSSMLNGTVSGVKLYLTAQNLLTFTKYTGWDPEIGASSTYSGTNTNLLQGVDFGFYPQPRTFIFGINMSF